MSHTYLIEFFPPKRTFFLKDEISRYKSLGFNIQYILGTPFHAVRFPNGWDFGDYKLPYGTSICDEKNRLRGWISFATRHMGLYTRYTIKSITKKTHKYIVIFDRSKSKILYQIGKYNNVEDEYELLGKARNYLNTNYPDWENFDAYWD